MVCTSFPTEALKIGGAASEFADTLLVRWSESWMAFLSPAVQEVGVSNVLLEVSGVRFCDIGGDEVHSVVYRPLNIVRNLA